MRSVPDLYDPNPITEDQMRLAEIETQIDLLIEERDRLEAKIEGERVERVARSFGRTTKDTEY